MVMQKSIKKMTDTVDKNILENIKSSGYTFVKTLTMPPYAFHTTIVIQNKDNTLRVLKNFPECVKKQALKEIIFAKEMCRHPNNCMSTKKIGHKDGAVDVTYEFADGGNLESYLKKINKMEKTYESRTHQIQFCKSVVRQLAEYAFHLQTVVRKPHCNINPNTILFRRDGVINVKSFDCLDEGIVRVNPRHFFEGNGYCAPEFRINVERRLKSNYRNDIWAIGAIAYSIMTGIDLMPEWAKEDVYQYVDDEPHTMAHTPGSNNYETVSYTPSYNPETNPIVGVKYRKTPKVNIETTSSYIYLNKLAKEASVEEYNNLSETVKMFVNHQRKYNEFCNFINRNNKEEWAKIFPDPFLRHIVRRCLRERPRERIWSSELLSYIYLVGGYTQRIPNELNNSVYNRQNLTPIPRLSKQYEWVGLSSWKFNESWENIHDAWTTDVAGLSLGYKVQVSPTSDINFIRFAINSHGEMLWGEQILHEMSKFLDQENGLFWINSIKKLNTDNTYYHIPEKPINRINEATKKESEDSDESEDTDVDNHISEIIKRDTNADNHTSLLNAHVLLQSLAVHLTSESEVQRKQHINLEIDRQRREVIKMRSSTAYTVCSRAMCYFNSGYMTPNVVKERAKNALKISEKTEDEIAEIEQINKGVIKITQINSLV